MSLAISIVLIIFIKTIKHYHCCLSSLLRVQCALICLTVVCSAVCLPLLLHSVPLDTFIVGFGLIIGCENSMKNTEYYQANAFKCETLMVLELCDLICSRETGIHVILTSKQLRRAPNQLFPCNNFNRLLWATTPGLQHQREHYIFSPKRHTGTSAGTAAMLMIKNSTNSSVEGEMSYST